MDLRQLLASLQERWQAFEASFAGLSDAELLAPNITGLWSVRDILGHVSTWEQESLKHLPLILKGERPPRYSITYGGIHVFNRVMIEQKRDLPLAEVRRQLYDIHAQLLAFLKSVPKDEFESETRFRHRLRLDTYSHYPKHARAIMRWREETSRGHA